jgi:hypothetical protein
MYHLDKCLLFSVAHVVQNSNLIGRPLMDESRKDLLTLRTNSVLLRDVIYLSSGKLLLSKWMLFDDCLTVTSSKALPIDEERNWTVNIRDIYINKTPPSTVHCRIAVC